MFFSSVLAYSLRPQGFSMALTRKLAACKVWEVWTFLDNSSFLFCVDPALSSPPPGCLGQLPPLLAPLCPVLLPLRLTLGYHWTSLPPPSPPFPSSSPTAPFTHLAPLDDGQRRPRRLLHQDLHLLVHVLRAGIRSWVRGGVGFRRGGRGGPSAAFIRTFIFIFLSMCCIGAAEECA